MAHPWWHGGEGGDHYEVLGYMYPNGLIIEGVPEKFLLEEATITSILVKFWHEDDEEKAQYKWVHNPIGGDLSKWLKQIRIAAARYGFQLEFGVGEEE